MELMTKRPAFWVTGPRAGMWDTRLRKAVPFRSVWEMESSMPLTAPLSESDRILVAQVTGR
jgi:hypothetical protein